MRKGEILPEWERDLTEKGGKHVIIKRDEDPCVNPVTDYDNIFYLHSNITREFCANESQKDYPGLPIEEIEDEDGCGTGEYRVKDDAVMFPVAAYIHGGIALSLGDGAHFPDQMWDVKRKAAWMWTDKKRFEEMCGDWMHVYDRESKKWVPAESEEAFREYLRSRAESLLNEWQMWNDGCVYGFTTEVSCVPDKRLYDDGHTEDEIAWEDGDDSCWGFITDNANDIGFPRGEGWKVFDATGHFVGDEYDIPEFVVSKVVKTGIAKGVRLFLCEYKEDKDSVHDVHWEDDVKNAIKFDSYAECQDIAKKVIGEPAHLRRLEYDPESNILELEEAKKMKEQKSE